MTPDELKALAAFLLGVAAGGVVAMYILWLERKQGRGDG